VLEELLRPLGLVPTWCARGDLSSGGLYYGPHVHDVPGGVVTLPMAADAPAYFGSRMPYRPEDVRWGVVAGQRVPYLFPRGVTDSLPDLVASAFYWLSGWQEVTTLVRDVHGRFPFHASLQAATRTEALPVVDHYRIQLRTLLEAGGMEAPTRKWRGHAWAVAPTHDIDFTHKSRLGTLARIPLRETGRRVALRQAIAAPDPRRAAVRRFAEIERELDAGATYFFKAAARGPWDAPYRLRSSGARALVATIQQAGFEIGLHPSYHAHDHSGHLAEERDRLATIVGRQPAAVRQHFLRFDTTLTPRLLAANGLQVDSTLGFAEREGFRQATSFPFRLYDADRDVALEVWEMPLAVMDATLFHYRGLCLGDAEAAAWRIMEAVRRVGGCAVLLWHNTAFDEVDFAGQGALFERLLRRACDSGAALLGLEAACEENGIVFRLDRRRVGPSRVSVFSRS
jgi:hypothetical protein